jgi:hypothetical protein
VLLEGLKNIDQKKEPPKKAGPPEVADVKRAREPPVSPAGYDSGAPHAPLCKPYPQQKPRPKFIEAPYSAPAGLAEVIATVITTGSRVATCGAMWLWALPYPCHSKSCHQRPEMSTWAALKI